MARSVMQRVIPKVEPVPNCGCWVWSGHITKYGYGLMHYKRRARHVHTIVFEHIHGPVPGGYTIDHKCRVRSCCNPDHLELVTHRENVLRGIGLAAKNAAKEFCDSGHPFDAENTYFYSGRRHRMCRICSALRRQRIASEQRARGEIGLPPRERTECPKGHQYSEENTRLSKGKRYCRSCDKDRYLARRAKATVGLMPEVR